MQIFYFPEWKSLTKLLQITLTILFVYTHTHTHTHTQIYGNKFTQPRLKNHNQVSLYVRTQLLAPTSVCDTAGVYSFNLHNTIYLIS